MTNFGKWLLAIVLVSGLSACSSSETGCKPGDYQDCYTGAEGTQDVGICGGGVAYCDARGQWGPCLDEQVPMKENCFNNSDDDCDGQVNEEGDGCECEPDSTQECYTGDPATSGVGDCSPGTWTCNPWGSGWGPCQGELLPGPENFERTGDENCDGLPSADSEWGFLFGADGAEIGTAVAADNSGNVIVGTLLMGEMTIGADEFKSPSGTDALLLKFDADGNYVWGVQIGDGPTGTDEQWISAMTVDEDDAVYITGRFMGKMNLGGNDLESYAHDDVFLAKFSKDGEHLWSWQLSCALCGNPSSGDKQPLDIALAGDRIVLVGQYVGNFGNPGGCLDGMCKLPTALDEDPFVGLFRTDDGTYLEVTHFTGFGTDSAKKVAVDSHGHFVIAGYFTNDHDVLPGVAGGDWNSYGYADVFVVKLDENLVPIWHQTLGTDGSDYIKGLALDPDDNPVIAATVPDDLGGNALLVIKLSSESNLIGGGMSAKEWPLLSRLFGGNPSANHDVAEALMDADGNLLLGGSLTGSATFGETTLVAEGSSDGFVLMLDHSFEPIWAKHIGSRTRDSVAGMALGQDRSIFLIGMTSDSINFGEGPMPFGGLFDGFVTKMYP